MNLVECLGEWQQSQTGEVICSGALQVVSSVSSFPELTFQDANLIVGAYAVLLATVMGVRMLSRVILPNSNEG